MTESRDGRLLALFAEAREELDGRELTERVVLRTTRRRLLWLGSGTAFALAALLAAWAWLAIPLLEFALLISQVLTASLVDLGEGWLALLLLPVNSLAGLVALSGKGILMLRRRLATGLSWR